MKAPKTLQEAIQYFSDYDDCREFMASVRWLDGVVRCPYCNSDKITYLAKARLYRCYGAHPKQKFSLKIGTVFEDSPIGLDKWLPAVWLVVNCKNGISSYELHRALGVTQKSAWFMLHRIRLAMQSKSFDKLGGPDSEVEVDESYVGGKVNNMHKSRKLRLAKARSEVRDSEATVSARYWGKTAVMGLLDREARKVRATVVPNVKRETLQNRILSESSMARNFILIKLSPMTNWRLRRSTLTKSSITWKATSMAAFILTGWKISGLSSSADCMAPMWLLSRSICFGMWMNKRSVTTIVRPKIIR
jgi:transposase-like protein